MEEGVLQLDQKDDNIAEFIINQAYPDDTYPISCILTGARGYGLDDTKSSRDYVGIHFMDTWECLEHPKYRVSQPVIRLQYDNDLNELDIGVKGHAISLDSFEIWKFIDVMLKGSPVAYEILYMPVIHQEPESAPLLDMCRSGLTNKIGKAAKSLAQYDWRKHKYNRERTLRTYHRLLQAVFYLREEEFEWEMGQLIEYAKPTGIITKGSELFSSFSDEKIRNTRITDKELEVISIELDRLVGEVDRAMMVTKFPDQYPEKVLSEVLRMIKTTRSTLI